MAVPRKSKAGKEKNLFLGFDCSTQSLKATAVDEQLRLLKEYNVNFERDLPQFKTRGGAHFHADGLTVTSPPLMWVAALDMVLDAMKKDGFPFDRVAAVSGSGQQHGSVYLAKGARDRLKNLDGSSSLRAQLEGIFSVAESPIWMDSSTTRQCRSREKAMGGAQAVAKLTGSRAYERFTGNQIAKIFQTQRAAYESCERIALVSSFAASLLIGDYAPIDAADGSGMNLMDIRSKQWVKGALDCTASGLKEKLGAITASHAVVGKVHRFYIDRYGFSDGCVIVAFSGDNPCSLAGLRLQHPGDIAVSLGTSNTVFGILAEPRPSATEGHIFANPVDPESYMALICWKNGSLTLEAVRDAFAGGSWKKFDAALPRTRAGNDGYLGFFIEEPEITPPILKTGTFLFGRDGNRIPDMPSDNRIRAVVEGQFLSMRLHSANIGIRAAKILATGGASVDKDLLKVMADVFGAPVYVAEQSSSASLGAAYRALHGWTCANNRGFVPFADIFKKKGGFSRMATPDRKAHKTYTAVLENYAELEQRVTGAS